MRKWAIQQLPGALDRFEMRMRRNLGDEEVYAENRRRVEVPSGRYDREPYLHRLNLSTIRK